MERSYPIPSQQDINVVGLLAFSALAAMTRLAKDGDQAPDTTAHIAHARMSATAFSRFEQLEIWAQHRGVDLVAAADQYAGLFDDLDARTRPTTWRERSVKTYVTMGIFRDFLREVADVRGLFAHKVDEWHLGQSAWVDEHLAPEFAADEQLAARLSLWARRVAGEVLGLVRATMFTHPDLSKDPDTADMIAQTVSKLHGERMAKLGLRA